MHLRSRAEIYVILFEGFEGVSFSGSTEFEDEQAFVNLSGSYEFIMSSDKIDLTCFFVNISILRISCSMKEKNCS